MDDVVLNHRKKLGRPLGLLSVFETDFRVLSLHRVQIFPLELPLRVIINPFRGYYILMIVPYYPCSAILNYILASCSDKIHPKPALN
jgi:hypothetical protein